MNPHDTIPDNETPSDWLNFEIDSELRKRVRKSKNKNAYKQLVIHPKNEEKLYYHSYLQLERLLASQIPQSKIPDERAFIIVHQLFELAFRLMIFDLAVIAKTFQELVRKSDEDFKILCQMDNVDNSRMTKKKAESKAACDKDEREVFWRPALNAAARTALSSSHMVSLLFKYLDEDNTFSSSEFFLFRPSFEAPRGPASGFQSAQFRLIQKTLGKASLLEAKLFPAYHYRPTNEGANTSGQPRVHKDSDLLEVDSKEILGGPGYTIAHPDNSLEQLILSLEDVTNAVLAKLWSLAAGDKSKKNKRDERGAKGKTNIVEESGVLAIRTIADEEIEATAHRFEKDLSNFRKNQKEKKKYPADAEETDREMAKNLRAYLQATFRKENERRQSPVMQQAFYGSCYLRRRTPNSHLSQVLNRIVSADNALHASGSDDSFLSIHLKVVKRQFSGLDRFTSSPTEGTGGGGLGYLLRALHNLFRLFPAIIAYRSSEY